MKPESAEFWGICAKLALCARNLQPVFGRAHKRPHPIEQEENTMETETTTQKPKGIAWACLLYTSDAADE